MSKSRKFIESAKCRINGYTVVTEQEALRACDMERRERTHISRGIAIQAFCAACFYECPYNRKFCLKLNEFKTKYRKYEEENDRRKACGATDAAHREPFREDDEPDEAR